MLEVEARSMGSGGGYRVSVSMPSIDAWIRVRRDADQRARRRAAPVVSGIWRSWSFSVTADVAPMHYH
jgi:hypothetical protein